MPLYGIGQIILIRTGEIDYIITHLAPKYSVTKYLNKVNNGRDQNMYYTVKSNILYIVFFVEYFYKYLT